MSWQAELDRRRNWILALASVALVALTYPKFAWSLRPEHFFFHDDWTWLCRPAFLHLRQYVTLWPHWIFNDRPVGALLITALYRLCGLNNVVFHAVWVAFHLLNTLLVFRLGLRLFQSAALAFVAAYAFGNWAVSTEAVTWVAAVFDLLSSTLLLASILTFLSQRAIVRGLSPVFYFLAMRTKENAILLPVLLLLLLLATVPRDRWRAECPRRLGWHFLLLALFAASYGYFYLTDYTRQDQPGDPYHLQFDLRTLATGGSYYLHAMLYRTPRLRIPLLAAGATLLLALRAVPGRRVVLLGAAGFVLFLLPVIFLPNHRYGLYLYVPSAFFAIGGLGLAQWAGALAPRPRDRNPLAAAVALGCFLMLPHGRAFQDRRDFLLTHTSLGKQNLEQVRQRFPTLKPGTKFVFAGLPPHVNPFISGPCDSLKLVYQDPTISCTLLDRGSPAPVPAPGEEGAIYGVLRSGRLEFDRK